MYFRGSAGATALYSHGLSREFAAESALEECAQSAPHSGKVEIKLVVTENGSVAKTELRKTTMRHGPTQDCMAQALQSVAFPPTPDGTTVILSWPMVVYVEEGL